MACVITPFLFANRILTVIPEPVLGKYITKITASVLIMPVRAFYVCFICTFEPLYRTLNVLGCDFVERSNATRDTVMQMVFVYVIAAILALTVMCMVSLLLITLCFITYELILLS